MKILKSLAWLFLCVWLIGSPPATAQSEDAPDPNAAVLESLLDELQRTIDEADKRMVAHPRFLNELRDLVDQYRAKLHAVYFFDNFSDGDYTRNPAWQVKSGTFRVTNAGRLWSRVQTDQPSRSTSSREEEPMVLIMKEILRSASQSSDDKSAAPAATESVIQTLATIGPTFEVDFSFLSKSKWGSMEVVLMGGKPATPRYRLVYHAAPSRTRPIEIIRERDGRRYTIESATQFPDLDNGALHRIQWVRDNTGSMRVLVDGKEVLSTVEVYYRDDFAGLRLENRGGDYEWGPIQIQQATSVGKN
jgi:hypothetical protein